MKYRFHSEAEFELIGAVQFYEKCSPPLGSEFLDEVDKAILSVLRNPQQFGIVEFGLRLAPTKRFPYGLIFHASDEILILAVMHLHRKPAYWQQRIP